MTLGQRDGSVRGGLLAELLHRGLIRSPEVAVTSSIAWLSRRPGGATAFGDLIYQSAGGLQQGADSTWFAEVRSPDGMRTDLECHWGDPASPRVVIEAKLDALLTVDQITSYLTDQRRRLMGISGSALLTVLVPAHRRSEAERVLAEANVQVEYASVGPHEGPLHTSVWDYNQVLQALAASLGDDPDLAQLRIFIESCEALDTKPFTQDELCTLSTPRRSDVIAVLDRATASASPAGQRLLPSNSDADFEWRRYLEVAPGWTNIAVGLRKPTDPDSGSEWPTPAWLRVHADTPDAPQAAARLSDGHASVRIDPRGSTWVPLHLPTGVGGAAIVQELAGQIRRCMNTISGLG